MGDVARWAKAKGARSLDVPELHALLTYFEDRYPPADFYVQNLIDVSFIENLGYESAIPTRFGPKLRQAHKELWESKSRPPDEPTETAEPRRPWWRRPKS